MWSGTSHGAGLLSSPCRALERWGVTGQRSRQDRGARGCGLEKPSRRRPCEAWRSLGVNQHINEHWGSKMIIWGSGGGGADLGVAEHKECATCEKERPFKVLLQYKYAHLYYLRWVTSKTYHLACDVCHRGWELKAKDVEPTLKENPIPFMTRYGWTFLVGFVVLVIAFANLSGK